MVIIIIYATTSHHGKRPEINPLNSMYAHKIIKKRLV